MVNINRARRVLNCSWFGGWTRKPFHVHNSNIFKKRLVELDAYTSLIGYGPNPGTDKIQSAVRRVFQEGECLEVLLEQGYIKKIPENNKEFKNFLYNYKPVHPYFEPHWHSASVEASFTTKEIIDYSRRMGLNTVCITNHLIHPTDSYKKNWRDYGKEKGINVLFAVEERFDPDYGEVLFIFPSSVKQQDTKELWWWLQGWKKKFREVKKELSEKKIDKDIQQDILRMLGEDSCLYFYKKLGKVCSFRNHPKKYSVGEKEYILEDILSPKEFSMWECTKDELANTVERYSNKHNALVVIPHLGNKSNLIKWMVRTCASGQKVCKGHYSGRGRQTLAVKDVPFGLEPDMVHYLHKRTPSTKLLIEDFNVYSHTCPHIEIEKEMISSYDPSKAGKGLKVPHRLVSYICDSSKAQLSTGKLSSRFFKNFFRKLSWQSDINSWERFTKVAFYMDNLFPFYMDYLESKKENLKEATKADKVTFRSPSIKLERMGIPRKNIIPISSSDSHHSIPRSTNCLLFPDSDIGEEKVFELIGSGRIAPCSIPYKTAKERMWEGISSSQALLDGFMWIQALRGKLAFDHEITYLSNATKKDEFI